MKFLSNNPIIRGQGVCDPHIHIFDGKAYLYASHDFSRENTKYTMKDWQIWSSTDLVNWQLERIIKPEETYIGQSSDCWATDAAMRNGKYYFYFSHKNRETGVCVSDRPAGPFSDVLHRPLLSETLTPTHQYDPAVFIDDDTTQTPYILFGAPVWANADSYYIAQLNEDMISLAEPPRKLELNDTADDKPFLHKYSGKYYLSWASFYAVADQVTGPYRFMGNIGASADHGSYFTWNNQWFHAFTIFDPHRTYRASGLCYIHYRANGEMAADQMIVEYGVGHYCADWNKIEAEWYMAGQGIQKQENPYLGFDVSVADGAQLFYPNVCGAADKSGLAFYAANHNAVSAVIEVREDTPDGTLLGSCTIAPTNSWDWRGYQMHCMNWHCPKDNVNLCLVCKGSGTDILRLDYFKFY